MGIDKSVYQDEYFLALPQKRLLLIELNNEPYVEHWKNLLLQSIAGEIWKDVVGYEGMYMISNYERVKSLARIAVRPKTGNIHIKERIIKHRVDKKDKYRVVSLSSGGQHIRNNKIHVLIALHFIFNPNPKKYIQVNHLNGNRGDNRIKNLEWVTRRQDLIHKYHILNYKFPDNRKGENSTSSKKVIQKQINGDIVNEWCSQGEIERVLGYNQSLISRACNNNTMSKGFLWQFKTAV